MPTIILSGRHAIRVDDTDFASIRKHTWFAHSDENGAYVEAMIDGRTVKLHRFIMSKFLNRPLTRTEDVIHKDGDVFNNTQENLKLTTRSQTLAGQKVRKTNTSGYKGVYKRGNRYAASIMHEYERTNIGCFATAELAAQAYNDKALELFGEHARLNEIKA